MPTLGVDDDPSMRIHDIRERLRRFLIRAGSRVHGGIYRISGGRLLGRLAGLPVLLMTTTGRRSGRPRRATLTYFRDGGDLVVIQQNQTTSSMDALAARGRHVRLTWGRQHNRRVDVVPPTSEEVSV